MATLVKAELQIRLSGGGFNEILQEAELQIRLSGAGKIQEAGLQIRLSVRRLTNVCCKAKCVKTTALSEICNFAPLLIGHI
ncbi:MAG: hypothetical protein R6U11_04825, partial [Bacteroidales bacterium]